MLGLLSFWLAFNYFSKMRAQYANDLKATEARLRDEFAKSKPGEVVVVQQEKKRPVVYAKTPIKAGDKIEAPMLQTTDTPETLLLAAYTKPDEVVGQYAMANIEVGEPLLPSNVSKQVQRMSVKLTPGMRAVSLPIENVKNVTGGFVTDGDLVDVLLSYGSGGNSRTVIVLQDVKVLYAPGPDDYRTDQTRPLKTRPGGEVVTFEVTPDQAEMLIQLSQMGTFRLILRNRDDTVQWKTKGFSSSEFFDDDKSPQRRSNRSVIKAEEVTKEIQDLNPEQTGGEVPNAK